MVDDLDLYRAGSTEPWTVEVLCALIRARQPSILIETGTFEARTTRKLVEACQSYKDHKLARLYTVESDPERSKLAWAILDGMDGVIGVEGDAIQFLSSFPKMADFVFLDDDHGAAHVWEEITLAKKVLRPGGIICVHDVIGPFGLDAVVARAGGVVLDFPRLHLAGGLGIIAQ